METMVPQILLSLLAVYMLLTLLAALFYLSYRQVTLGEFVFWGCFALFVPVFGPFFVIAARPGPRKRDPKRHPGFW